LKRIKFAHVTYVMQIDCFILLGTYLLNEFRFDRFHQYADRIALVTYGLKSPEDAEMRYMLKTPTAVGPTLEKQFPEVEKAVRLYSWRVMAVRHGSNCSTNQTSSTPTVHSSRY